MEKFERLNEVAPQRDIEDNILIFVIIFVGIILGSAWYYQNYIFSDPNYENKNDLKKLEEQEKFLESEIERILKETKRIENSNKAQIFINNKLLFKI